MSNVVNFQGITLAPIPPDKVLEAAKGKLSEAVIIGLDGEELYFAGSTSDMALVLMLLKRAERRILDMYE